MFTWSRRSRHQDSKVESSLQEQQACGADPQHLAPADSAESVRPTRVALQWLPLPTLGPTNTFRGSGRYVAAEEWTRAIGRYGSTSTLDIFAPFCDLEHCRRQFSTIPTREPGARSAIGGFFPDSDIRARFQACRYDVLHMPLDLAFDKSSYLRSRFSQHVYPITYSQMGVSYSCELYAGWISLLTAQVYPCDAIVCSTDASRRALEKRLEDIAERYSRAWGRPSPSLPRLELIPWGVDTQRFTPRDRTTARRDLDLPLDRPVVLCIARVRIQDKMDWTPLLLAFERVTRMARNRPLLVLAGANPSEYGQELVAQAAQLGLRDSVRTFFNLPPACLPSLYAACDVFTSPVDSPSESFGLTIVEAMACSRPVVASDWNGYKELIVHGETGFKVRTDWADCLGDVNNLAPVLSWEQEHLHVGQSVNVDVPELATYILRLVENQELCEEMGQRGRARVEALYDWSVVIAQWEALWAELSATARCLSPHETDQMDFLQPNYFQHFSHYASRIIDDSIPVCITARGRELLAGKTPLFLHPWAQGFIHPQHLSDCLLALKPTGWKGMSVAVEHLLKVLKKTAGLSRNQGLMHLMWLAKYDLISLGGGGPLSDGSQEPCSPE
jgi:D-inositol-3-phosphate glycosyltransferase